MRVSVRGRKGPVFLITRIMARIFLAPFFQIKPEGQESLPKEGAFILLPKHQRWEDIPLLALASPRPLYYVAKYELFTNLFSGWYMSSLGGIPLNRARPLESRRSIRTIIALLKQGEGLVIFPEGTYFEDEVGPGRVGLIRMIRSRINVPFIPVGINYSRKMKRRRPVQITFGRPVCEDASVDSETLIDKIMKDIARLSALV